jgi:hypothetical protein
VGEGVSNVEQWWKKTVVEEDSGGRRQVWKKRGGEEDGLILVKLLWLYCAWISSNVVVAFLSVTKHYDTPNRFPNLVRSQLQRCSF